MANTADALTDLAREVDLLVFRLERPVPPDQVERERRTLRRELERIRDALEDAARTA